MEIDINWLAITLAALSTLVIGSIWYAPKAFGGQWRQMTHPGKKKESSEGALGAILVALAVSFVTAYTLAHFAFLANQYFGNSFLHDSLATAFWAWLGFTAARLVTHDAFEGRRQRLTLINIGHELVVFMTMGLIIGLLAP